jgi:hypothetical protein
MLVEEHLWLEKTKIAMNLQMKDTEVDREAVKNMETTKKMEYCSSRVKIEALGNWLANKQHEMFLLVVEVVVVVEAVVLELVVLDLVVG